MIVKERPVARLEDFGPLVNENIRKTERIPPGQHLAKKWPVLSVEKKIPPFDGKDWDVTIDGLVENPVTLTWEEFLRLPKKEVTVDLHCVTTWSLLDQNFAGVPFSVIVELVKPKPEAQFVTFEAFSGYATALPLYGGYLDRDDALLAYEYDGKPLPREHGGPLRLIVPHLYLWKSVKWLKKMHFLDVWERGFWEVKGYHQRGDPWQEERFSRQERVSRHGHEL